MVWGCWGTLLWPFYLNWFSVITWGIWNILYNTFWGNFNGDTLLEITHFPANSPVQREHKVPNLSRQWIYTSLGVWKEGRNKIQEPTYDSGCWYYSKLTFMCWVTPFLGRYDKTPGQLLKKRGRSQLWKLMKGLVEEVAADSEALVSLSKVCNNPFPWGANLRIWTGENCIISPT